MQKLCILYRHLFKNILQILHLLLTKLIFYSRSTTFVSATTAAASSAFSISSSTPWLHSLCRHSASFSICTKLRSYQHYNTNTYIRGRCMSSVQGWHPWGWFHVSRYIVRHPFLSFRNFMLSCSKESKMLKLWRYVWIKVALNGLHT